MSVFVGILRPKVKQLRRWNVLAGCLKDGCAGGSNLPMHLVCMTHDGSMGLVYLATSG